MGRYTFCFVLGLVAGATGVITYQSLRKKSGEETPDNLIATLGEKLHSLETRFIGAQHDQQTAEVTS
jgi:hypothetical protein